MRGGCSPRKHWGTPLNFTDRTAPDERAQPYRLCQENMKLRIATIALTIAILLPFLVNLLGWNIYAYLNFGEKDLILASALGVSHNAWAEHFEEDVAFGIAMPDDLTTTIIDIGFFNLFLERRGDLMTPFTFRWIQPDEYSDYRGFEFPWLLLLLIPFTIMVAPGLKRRQSKSMESNG